MSDRLSPELRAFVQRHISSIEQIEILLLLRGASDRAWTPVEVAAALKMPREAAGMRLFLLASAKLLSAQGSTAVRYRYAPPDGAEVLVEQLAQAYQQHGAQLLEVVSTPPVDPLRSFADAFKLKK